MLRKLWTSLSALAVLAGCGSPPPPAPKTPPNTGFNVSPDGTKIVLFANDAHLYLLDLLQGKASALLPELRADTVPQFFDNQRLLIVGRDDKGLRVELLAIADGALKSCRPDRSIAGITLAPDGKFAVCLAVKDKYSHLVSIDLETCAMTPITAEGVAADTHPLILPERRGVIFLRGLRHVEGNFVSGAGWTDNDFWFVNLDGSGLKQLTHKRYVAAPTLPLLVDNGRRVAFTAYEKADPNNQDSKMNEQPFTFLIGEEPKPFQIGGSPAKHDGAVYASLSEVSRDGQKIAFLSDRALSYEYNYWIANADGSSPVQISFISMDDVKQKKAHWLSQPHFSPDGKTVYLYSRSKDTLYRVDAGGKNFKPLGSESVFERPLEWKLN